jgi:hypothetical protein
MPLIILTFAAPHPAHHAGFPLACKCICWVVLDNQVVNIQRSLVKLLGLLQSGSGGAGVKDDGGGEGAWRRKRRVWKAEVLPGDLVGGGGKRGKGRRGAAEGSASEGGLFPVFSMG